MFIPGDLAGAAVPADESETAARTGTALDTAPDPAADPVAPAYPAAAGPAGAAPPHDLARAVAALAGARRPLLLAGLGAWRSGAGKILLELGDRIGALYTTTVMASGLFHDSPWSLGVCGGFADPAAAALAGEADVIVAFGARLDTFTLHGGRILDPAATVVQVDLTAGPTAERVDVHVRGDAAVVAAQLLDALAAPAPPPPGWRTGATARALPAGWAARPYEDASAGGRIDPPVPSPRHWPLCCRRSAPWSWTAGTSSAGPRCTGGSPIRPGSCSPARPSRASASASRAPSARPSAGPTAPWWRRWGTAAP
ncbi:hypothetical protein GCM10020254_86400 [Streptomyces goshikiensis]